MHARLQDFGAPLAAARADFA
nr:hypothetical protein [Neorhizobium huautlense]